MMRSFQLPCGGRSIRTAALFLLLLLLPAPAAPLHAQTSSLVYEGEDGRLQYAAFANLGEDDTVHVVPDFSWAGYKFSEVPIPDVPVVIELEPSGGDDRGRIQSAIDQIEAMPLDENGFRGALLLKKGYYIVRGGFTITESGVVIRGEGQLPAEQGGTQIHVISTYAHDLFTFLGDYKKGEGGAASTRTSERNSKTGAAGPSHSIVSNVASGSHAVEIADASSFSVGDRIHVLRTPNDAWIDDIGMREYYWTPESYTIPYERTIVGIHGNVITVDVPFVQAFTSQYGLGEVYLYDPSYRIGNVGVENLFLTSFYRSQEDENHVENAVYMENVEHGWIRNVTSLNFMRGTAKLYWSFNVTVQDCALLDPVSRISGSRRYSFEVTKGSFNLFQRLYARNGRHDYVTGSRVTGPNVFVDSYATQTHSDIGPHFRFSSGLLFDNIRGGDIRTRNRGFTSSGAGHGWTGGQVMFWNVEARAGFEFVNDHPVSTSNWDIGTKGTRRGNGFSELYGQDAEPRSLFYRQLEDRVGRERVLEMTTQTQRNGMIFEALRLWGGYGELDPNLSVSAEREAGPNGEPLPTDIVLEQNYPNPFNPVTTIRYAVPANAPVTLDVFTLAGQPVRRLAEGPHTPGQYAVEFDAADLPTGTYFYRLQAGDRFQTRKMLLMK